MFHKASVAYLALASVFEKELTRLIIDTIKYAYFYSQTSVTDCQAQGEVSSPKKRAFSTSKNNFVPFFPFCGPFLPS